LLFHSPFSLLVEENTFQVAEDVSFVTSSERHLLNKLAHLGFQYKLLLQVTLSSFFLISFQFCADKRSIRSDKKQGNGQYVRALAGGINKILDTYRKIVLSIESSSLKEASVVPLPKIHATLQQVIFFTHQMSNSSKYELVFDKLTELCNTITKQNIFGTALLSLLHQVRR
jgi:hypothetical protein